MGSFLAVLKCSVGPVVYMCCCHTLTVMFCLKHFDCSYASVVLTCSDQVMRTLLMQVIQVAHIYFVGLR